MSNNANFGGGSGQPTYNADDRQWMERLVGNVTSMRDTFFNRFFDGPRDINRECMYPETGALNNAWFFKELYNREPIANRVCQLMPKESWAKSPLIYEDEDPENETDFERAWDELGQALRGEQCWYKDEDGSPVWEHLRRADILSGIGYYGVILVGIDDGRNLDQPADGVMTLNPTQNRLWPSKPRAAPFGTDEVEITVNKDGRPFEDMESRSAPMVPVHNGRGSVDFVSQDRAEAAVTGRFRDGTPCFNRLVVNTPKPPDRGMGPNQARHDADHRGSSPGQDQVAGAFGGGGRGGQEPQSGRDGIGGPSSIGGAGGWPTSFAGAQGTDAQYVGVELSPPEYPTDKPSKDKRKLLFLRCFDETLVQIVQYEADVRNPRFGLPVMYRITLNDPSTQHSGVGLPLATVRVHWSRVIHLADNLDNSEIFGVPRQRPVLNPILDVRKIRGAGAEGYWRSCFTGISLETAPQLGGDVSVDVEASKRMLQDYFMDLNRGFVLMGMSAKTIAPTVVDPTPHININIEAICIQLACPIRVFKGSERGELASSQDDDNWNDRVRERQHNYLTPRVIVVFIDRLIALGVLPVPKAGGKNDGDREGDAQLHPVAAARAKADGASVGAAGDGAGRRGNGVPPGAKGSGGGGRSGGGGVGGRFGGKDAERGNGKPVGNRWEERRRSIVTVINAFGKVESKDVADVEPDDRVLAKKPVDVKSAVMRTPQGYSVEWPDVSSLGHAAKAAIALQETQALAAYVSGNLEALLPPQHFFTDVMQWPEERSRQIVEDAKAHQEDTMTIPAAGDPDHPASGSPPPPPPNPLMVPHGSKVGPGVKPPGGIITGPKPADQPQQPQVPAGLAPHPAFGGPPKPIQNADSVAQLTKVCDSFYEREGRGRALFWNSKRRIGWWQCFDDEDAVMLDRFLSRLGKVAGVRTISVAPESTPPPGAGWREVWPGPVRNSATDEIEARLIVAVREALAGADTGPDYQRLFFDEQSHTVWWVSADNDDPDEVDRIVAALETVPGVESVRAEAEALPRGKDWVELRQSRPHRRVLNAKSRRVAPPKAYGGGYGPTEGDDYENTPSEDDRLQHPDADARSRPTPQPSLAQRQHTIGDGYHDEDRGDRDGGAT